MRFYMKRPTLGQLLIWRIKLGRMMRCPDCHGPVTRERALEVDRAWKHHFDYCLLHQQRVAREDADAWGDSSA